MMLKLLFAGCPATMDAYRARTRRCVGLFAALAVLGAATWLFGFFGVPELLPEGARRSYFSGFYTGMGTALAGCGLVLAVPTAQPGHPPPGHPGRGGLPVRGAVRRGAGGGAVRAGAVRLLPGRGAGVRAAVRAVLRLLQPQTVNRRQAGT